MKSVWELYAAALTGLALPSCQTMDDFRELMAEQAENAKMCRDEAPEIADRVRVEALKRKSELENGK